MIAHASRDWDRESMIAHLERCAAVDADKLHREQATLGEVESHEPQSIPVVDESSAAVGELEDHTDLDEVVTSEQGEPQKPSVAEIDYYHAIPRCDDYENDRAETASSPEYDPDADYPWIDLVVHGADEAYECHELPAENAQSIELPSDPIERLQVLVTAAKYGDEEAVIHIRECLDHHPEIWQQVGDLAAHAESLLIQIIAEDNQMVVESMEREVKRLKAELGEGDPSPLERLTIQRIVAAWLHCQYVDRAVLAADAAGSRVAMWGKRQEAAEKRFQTAIKSLDSVRRLRPRRASKPSGPADARATQRDSEPCAEQGRATDNSQIDGKVREDITKVNGFEHHNRIKKFLPEAAIPVS